MDIGFEDTSESFSPLMRRYIALMIAFVCINITIIFEDLKVKGNESQTLFAFKIFFLVVNLIVIFFYCLNYSVILVFKVFDIKSQIKRILVIVGIAAALLLIYSSIVVIFFVLRPDWFRTLYADIQCFQLSFIQIFIIVDTVLINWNSDFFDK